MSFKFILKLILKFDIEGTIINLLFSRETKFCNLDKIQWVSTETQRKIQNNYGKSKIKIDWDRFKRKWHFSKNISNMNNFGFF